jgi:hypothetical protein
MTNEERNFRWAYQLLLALAKRRLRDANDEREHPNDWPAGQEWDELVGSSHGTFLRSALQEAGVPYKEFLALIRSGEYDLDDLYDPPSEPSPSTPRPA